MNRFACWVGGLAALLVLVGCAARGASVPDSGVPHDAEGALDADSSFPIDAGGADAFDAGEADAGPVDLGAPDLGGADLGPPDLGPADLGAPDLGSPDLGPPDLGGPVICDACGTCDANPANDCYLCGGSNTDDVFNAGTSTGGPNLHFAVRFSAASAMNVIRAEVFTGEATGTNTLTLWSDNSTSVTPVSALTSADFEVSSTDGWQGATFDTVASFTAGTFGWVDWQPMTGQQASFTTAGTNVTYRGVFGTPTTWGTAYMGLCKLRVYCVD